MTRSPPPIKPRGADGRPDFLVRLGLGLPVTLADVEQAYLEKVKSAHPDRGGSQQDFLGLQEAYGRAKEYASFQASRRNWLGDAIERYAKQQELAGEIHARGGRVKVKQLDWLAGEIGEDFAQVLETIDGVSLTGLSFDDAALAALKPYQDVLGQLHELDLSGSGVTDAGAAQVPTLFPYLRRLNLSGTKVGNATLRGVANLSRLEWLNVAGTAVNRLGRFWLRVARPDLSIARSERGATRGFSGHVPALAVICLGYLAAMATATHVPIARMPLPKWGLSIDKVFHTGAYAVLAFLLATLAAAIFTGREGKRWTHAAIYAAVLPIVALYGVVDELTQPAVGRTADLLDWIADFTGAVAGVTAFFIVRFVLKRRAQRRDARLAAQRLAPIG